MSLQPQYLTALDVANRARSDIAAVLAEIKAGKLRVSLALYDRRAQPIQLGRLLGAQSRWGTQRVGRELHALKYATAGVGVIDLNIAMRVRDLTDRQRRGLALWLDSRP